MAFYAAVGKRPIRLRQEVPGHVANRLQAALWREAYSLVERGVATVADIDTAIAHGPGLRWAVLGPFVNQHLSGGPGGIAHILEHLGPPTEAWWRDLGQVTLTPELVAKLVAGVDDELAGVDPAELVARRDAVLHAPARRQGAGRTAVTRRRRNGSRPDVGPRIDVHVHVEQDSHGCFALDQELMDASARTSRPTEDRTPTLATSPSTTARRRMAAVVFTVDADRRAPGTRRCPARRSPTRPPSTRTC